MVVSAAQTVAVGEVVLVVVKPSRARGRSLELELRKFRAALVSLGFSLRHSNSNADLSHISPLKIDGRFH